MRVRRGIATVSVATTLVAGILVGTAPSASADRFTTMRGATAPGTPAQYNVVRVLKQGPRSAPNVLVLVPGTSAGASYFRPVAKAMLRRLKGWQIWSVERRENLLEDHNMLRRYRKGKATARQLLDYYLGWLTNPAIQPHFTPKTTDQTTFARDWGLRVAVADLRRVVRAADRHHGRVVLGGHSLGGRIAAGYATWNFQGKPGAKDLDGLVFIDGSSGGSQVPTADQARADLAALRTSSPFIDILGVGLPWASGLFNAIGSTTALTQPNERSDVQALPLLPAALKPPVPATNLAVYGYGVDVDTSPPSLALVHSHIGNLASSGDPRGWVDGQLGGARRAASVFAEFGSVDGSAWYHPTRLSLDARSVNNGNANPAQPVFGVKSTFGNRVHLPMYAFDTSLGAGRVGKATRALARQSGVPKRCVVTVNRSKTYAHIDPLSAEPSKNAFLKSVVPFLKQVAPSHPSTRWSAHSDRC